MVSIHPELETLVDLKCYKVAFLDSIAQFITQNYNQLQHDNNFIGSWISNDMIYLDVSISVVNIDEALSLAKEHDQIAIFDISSKEEIFVKNIAA